MDRKIYIEDAEIALAEYIGEVDHRDCFLCWQDEATQSGYNHQFTETFEEFEERNGIYSRFIATIIRRSDHMSVGVVFVSPEGSLPDLAIMIYKPYRGKGIGTKAYALSIAYCFDALGLESIYAGCYPHNKASLAMLKKCGFVPHPEGNQKEKHYLTGDEIIQLDFVLNHLSR